MNYKAILPILLMILVISCEKEQLTIEKQLLNSEMAPFGDPTIYAGDMILTEKQVQIITDYDQSIGQNNLETRGATKALFNRWSNCVVRFKFDTEDELRPQVRQRVINAMTLLEGNTNIRFRHAATTAPRWSYVLITASADGSQATIGMGSSAPIMEILDKPNINIRLDLQAKASEIMHELGHVVGLIHEHQRSDRDDFVNVNYENIDCFNPKLVKNYSRLAVTFWKIPSNNLTPFDFQSIMIYSSCACAKPSIGFSLGCDPVMTRLNGTPWSANSTYSANDFAAINAIYSGCSYSGGGGNGPTLPTDGPIK